MSDYIDKIVKNGVEYDIYAERANKTADGKDIDAAIAEAQLAGNIPVLTQETAEEIYKTKPKFIINGTWIYVLQEIADPDVYYSSVYNEVMSGINITNEEGVYSFTKTEIYPASTDYVDQNKGTKLYKHFIGGSTSFTLIDSNSKPLNEEASGYGIQTRIDNGIATRIEYGPIIARNASAGSITMHGVGYQSYPTEGLSLRTLTLTAGSFTDTVTPL